jgi:hypothetical protein
LYLIKKCQYFLLTSLLFLQSSANSVKFWSTLFMFLLILKVSTICISLFINVWYFLSLFYHFYFQIGNYSALLLDWIGTECSVLILNGLTYLFSLGIVWTPIFFYSCLLTVSRRFSSFFVFSYNLFNFPCKF